MQLHILPNKTDRYPAALMPDSLNQLFPLFKFRLRRTDAQFTADNVREIGLFKHQRRFIKHGQRQILNHTIRFHIAETGNLSENAFIRDFLVYAQNDQIRRYAQSLKLFDRMLCGFGFMLAGRLEIRYEGHMNVQCVLLANLQANLPDRLDKRLTLHIANGSANLRNHHICIRLVAYAVDESLDFIGNVRNRLNRIAQIAALTLARNHIGIDFARRQVGILIQVFVDKTLVMTQIQIGFCTVFCDIHLAMLIRAHGSGINIDIGIQFLRGHLEPSRLQQSSQ